MLTNIYRSWVGEKAVRSLRLTVQTVSRSIPTDRIGADQHERRNRDRPAEVLDFQPDSADEVARVEDEQARLVRHQRHRNPHDFRRLKPRQTGYLEPSLRPLHRHAEDDDRDEQDGRARRERQPPRLLGAVVGRAEQQPHDRKRSQHGNRQHRAPVGVIFRSVTPHRRRIAQ